MVKTIDKVHDVDSMVLCPIFNAEIDSAYCYEINSVAFGLCTANLINNVVDRATAKDACSSCPNRQM